MHKEPETKSAANITVFFRKQKLFPGIFFSPIVSDSAGIHYFCTAMKTKQELTDILDFVAEYASYLLGSGVHTSRVIRNAQRIGTSQGVDIQLSSFRKA